MTTAQPDLFDAAALDLERARSGRDDGIRRAQEHADADVPNWSHRAYAFLLAYSLDHAEFMTEDLRAAAADAGLPAPDNPKAWGGIVKRARAAGVITASRYEPQRSATCHCSPKPVWRSTACRA